MAGQGLYEATPIHAAAPSPGVLSPAHAAPPSPGAISPHPGLAPPAAPSPGAISPHPGLAPPGVGAAGSSGFPPRPGLAQPGSGRAVPTEKDFPPVEVPEPLPSDFGVWGAVRFVQFISKHSSRSDKQRRAMLLAPPFLIQLRLDGTITRIVPLDRIAEMQFDTALNRCLLVTTAPPKQDRDWLFEWMADHRNTYTPERVLDCINAFRRPLVPQNEPPLVYKPVITSEPVLKLLPPMLTPKDMLEDYKQHPEKIPAPRPEPVAVLPPAGHIDRYQIQRRSGEPLGLLFVTRGTPPETGLWVCGLDVGGAAHRAGLRPARILSVDGHLIYNEESLRRAMQKVNAAGKTDFIIEQERLEGFAAAPPELEGHTVYRETPDEPLGIRFALLNPGELYIEDLQPGGAAFRAGLPQYARIHSADGVVITAADGLKDVLESLVVNDRSEFMVETAQIADPEDFDHFHGEEEEYAEDSHAESREWSLPSVDAQPVPGASRAVIIGIDYHRAPRADVRLPGSADTAEAVRADLLTRGFGPVRSLIDRYGAEPSDVPTRANIVSALKWLTDGARPGDSLFLGYLGHGLLFPGGPPPPRGACGIVPADFRRSSTLKNAELASLLVDQLPEGARLFILCDMAQGGYMLHLPFRLASTSDGGYDLSETPRPDAPQQVCQLALARDRFTSPGVSAPGVLVRAFLEVLRCNAAPTWQEVLDDSRDLFAEHVGKGMLVPEMGSTQRFDASIDGWCSEPRAGVDGPETPMSEPEPRPQTTGLSTHTRASKPQTEQHAAADAEQAAAPAPAVRRGPGAPTPAWLLGGSAAKEAGVPDLLYMPLPQRQHPPGCKSAVSTEMRRRLIAFYRYYNPDQLPKVTSMLLQYKGQEALLFRQLTQKYGPEPADLVDDDLPDGWQQVQSSKGDVFYRHNDGRRQWEKPERSGGPPRLGWADEVLGASR
eukprot:TRINITY_DN23449_c1_g1_i1.p1 TRINITY_DN23449_c1_g1~~TRINITY_DN23449_c1_g1_i1.p1  ORF type:complete len:960 (+),score=178.68 TRINITY_DN23449_c1_g1_i1:54-2882(+)